MGLLRLVLAVAVLLAHVEGNSYSMTGGPASVQCFYIISGFFIAMIYERKYVGQTKIFYANRLLRIFSVYWLFLMAALAFHSSVVLRGHQGLAALWKHNLGRMGHLGASFLGLSNLFIFGQDWTLFLALGDHGLHWTTNFQNCSPILPAFMLIPPAWSLGVELCFYLVAPWILRRSTGFILAIIGASLCFRYVLWNCGLRDDPWNYRFFPFEIGTFLLGVLSYRVIYRELEKRHLNAWLKFMAVAIFPAIAIYPSYDRSTGRFFNPAHLAFYAYMTMAVAILFRWTGQSKIDRQLGETSYPFYLCHWLVLDITARVAKHLGWGVFGRATIAIIFSLWIAYMTARYFDAPINRFRQRMLSTTVL